MSNITKQDFAAVKNSFLQQGKFDEKTFNKEVSFAVQHCIKNPYILNCTKESIQQTVLNVAQTGLSLNPVSKLAYMVPRKSKNGLECCLDPSYIGLIKLLTDTGSLKSISAQVVYDSDTFEIDLASQQVMHRPDYKTAKKDKRIIGVYALAVLPDGLKQVEYMTIDEVYDIRDRSEAYKSFASKQAKGEKAYPPIWVTDETEMIRKTVIKRIYKYLPRTERHTKIDMAIDLDNRVNGFRISNEKCAMIESLVHNSIISDEQKQEIENSLNEMTDREAADIITYLQDNQKQMENPRQKDIQEMTKNAADKDEFYERN